MKATGIVRRIDELGRIVIPKELRRTLKIREGDPIEIFTGREGEMILKKYSPIADIESRAENMADSISLTLGLACVIVDNDRIVFASGESKKLCLNSEVGPYIAMLIRERKQGTFNSNSTIPLLANETIFPASLLVCPILRDGDCFGAIVLFTSEKGVILGDKELKVVEAMSTYLGTLLS